MFANLHFLRHFFYKNATQVLTEYDEILFESICLIINKSHSIKSNWIGFLLEFINIC